MSAPISRLRRTLPLAARVCRRAYATAPSTTSLPPPRLNYKNISENVVYKATNAMNRKCGVTLDDVQDVARTHKEVKAVTNQLNALRNTRSMIGERIRRAAQQKDDKGKEEAMIEATNVKKEIATLEDKLATLEQQLLRLALAIPNDTHPDAPLGPEDAAVTLSTHGPEPIPADPRRDHVAFCKKFGLLDLESGATVSGTSWVYLTNEAALLELALTNYALSIAVRHGFTPVMPPDVVRADVAYRCGFQPRDDQASQIYDVSTPTSSSQDLILAGTAEIPLAGMFANKIFPSTSLPRKVVGMGHAFRAEAGARGADTRGLYRVHQFSKVELFAVTDAESSEAMMAEMASIQTEILRGLGLSLRVLDMPTEELGASAYRKTDIEAWMPGRGKWGELSSLSNCTDYQSRRLHIRYRPQALAAAAGTTTPVPAGALPFAHTLNGTAAAIPRLIVALIENGITFDEAGEAIGLALPEALKPFWLQASTPRIPISWT
ncbi:seryl-tRNA synthetase [Schizophyllum commune H4-8]|uniref:serine--tRNA ligase n=1 Tax=Schizophyllum commune (strain H4-8 / FGSC 9210) TaxID=578458 RepID=D8PSA5_SCHCM|nr:seryl-tRNA synthetase [Schizophyllum commune H4-8]KAI5897836.1 seryl-tRNA synthetase [Schizophyllum commune H4-8]